MSLVILDEIMDIIWSHFVLPEKLRKHTGLKHNTRSILVAYFAKKVSHELCSRRRNRQPRTSRGLLAICATLIPSQVRQHHRTTPSPRYLKISFSSASPSWVCMRGGYRPTIQSATSYQSITC